MKCKVALELLSPLLDEALQEDEARVVSGHMDECAGCRREYERLTRLRKSMLSLSQPEPPHYLRHLVQIRLENEKHDTWPVLLREELEYRWSRIRTLEGIWYVTRLLGTAATFVLFFAIVAAVRPMYFDLPNPAAEKSGVSQAMRQQLSPSVLKNLGLTPLEAQRKPIPPSDPQINDLYLLNFGQTASRTAQDGTVSVVTVVDRSGAVKIQNVLEYPADSNLLAEFNDMLQSARARPASQNGRAVDAHLVMTFSKISVYD